MCTELVKHPMVDEVICAGRHIERAKKFAERLRSEKLTVMRVDMSDIEDLRRAIKDVDMAINAATYFYNLRTLKACAEAGAHYQDLALGEPIEEPKIHLYDALMKELALDQDFKDKGITALINNGMDPGITDAMACHAAHTMDRVYEIRMKDCDIIDATEPISTWSPYLLWRDMVAPARVFVDGRFETRPPFSEEEYYRFPEPIGVQPCYQHAHEEIVIMGHYLRDKGLRYVEFKMCGPDMPYAKAIYDLGLANPNPIKVKGVEVAPFDLLIECLPKPLSMEEVEQKIREGVLRDEIACILTDIIGERKGKTIKATYYAILTLKEANKYMPGTTATSYFVGIGAEAMTELLIEGKITTRGVVSPEALSLSEIEAYFKRLAEKGIIVNEVVHTPMA